MYTYFLKVKILFYLCVFLCVFVCMWVSMEIRRVCQIPQSGVTGDYEALDVVLGTELRSSGKTVCTLSS